MENLCTFICLRWCNRAVLRGLAGLVAGFSILVAPCTWAQPAATAEWTKGQIVKIDTERAKITLKHDAIKNIEMDAMTMPFKVSQTDILKGLNIGDKVVFQVALVDSVLVITTLKAAP
jgi:Cu(I)/Ag(I) efflux system periplasmic protein CusF